jgi:O-antigen/teichoic acid export membrane protein
MAMVCVSFAALFTDPALGTALVQRKQITEADLSTVFWTTLAVGVVAMVVCIGISGYVADIFGQHEVKKLFIVLSFGLFLSGISVTQLALLTRELAYRSIEIREIFATLAAAACALGVAIAGFGPWAIITNWLVFSTASAVLVWFMTSWRPSFTFSMESLRDLGGFGIRIFGARLLGWANLNMDNLLVGRYLGAAALGDYALAYNVMYLPVTRISLPLASVFSPAYARMQDDPERLRLAWLKSKKLISTLLAPAFMVVIVVAPDLIPVVFGSKWHAAVLPVQLLSVAGLAQTLVGLHWSILTALKKPKTLLHVGFLVTGVTVGAFIAGLPFGIVGVAGFYAAARWILVPIDTWMTTRAVSFPFWSALRAGAEILPFAFAAAGIGFGLRVLLVHAGLPPVVRLFGVSAVEVAVYVGLLRLIVPHTLAEIWASLRHRGG